MGGLIELVMAYGIFMVCFTLGLVSVYSNLASNGKLYETRRAGSSQTLEVEARTDALAYSAFLDKAQRYRYGSADICPNPTKTLSSTDFLNTHSILSIPAGYQVSFARPNDWNESLTSGTFPASQAFVAQLRNPNGRLMAEVLLRC